MDIPNDKGGSWRLDKFVEYQHYAPAVDPLTLVEYAKRKKLSPDDCVMLAWYHSLTYCEITAAFLFEQLNFKTLQLEEVEQFWKDYKPKLIFGSARRYVKNMDWFIPLMNRVLSEITLVPRQSGKSYKTSRQPYAWLKNVAGEGTAKEKYKNIELYMSKWQFMGRFSVDLFTEEIIAFYDAGLIDIQIEAGDYDWKKTSNLTSGLYNIFYQDELADQFDRDELKLTNNLLAELDAWLLTVLFAVEEKYPDQTTDKVSVVNKICSFRNLFKKSRYGGFHHDRQLGNLIEYKESIPGAYKLWDLMFEIRSAIFPKHMLGERGHDNLKGYWTGIRKTRKKLWVEKGLTGVEQSK